MRNAKLVEDAACLCSAMAWSWSLYEHSDGVRVHFDGSGHSLDNFCDSLASSNAAHRLAWFTFLMLPTSSFSQRWALACSLLRNHEIPVGKGRAK